MVILSRSTRALVGLCVTLALACARGDAPRTADPASLRHLPAGDAVGFVDAYGAHAWLGLPFAAPPTGALRWRAPQPAPRWDGVREALRTGEACPQYASPYAGAERGETGVIGSEDCLALDVWAPPFAADAVPAGLPVMVWIHGGGNSIGRAGFYQGGNLAKTHGVVVVAIQYRLGPLGWFRHAALRENADALDASGNYGTLDLIRALEWVRENVTAFGGDPGNVTIFGESAGGTNVLTLLLARQADGLFHRAILQSAGFGNASPAEAESFREDGGAEQSASEVAAQLLVLEGAAKDRAEARTRLAAMPLSDVADWLRAKSPSELLAAYTERGQGMLFFPSVIRDGVVVPSDPPQAALERGAAHRVPVLLGTNRDENKLFMAFDADLARWRLGIFPVPLDPDHYQARAEAQAHAWKARGVDEPARALTAGGGNPDVYAYRWDWDEEPRIPGLYDGGFVIGAAHGLEIPFVFGHWDVGPESGSLFTRWNREGREALAAAMMSYWAEFAHRGSPGRGRGGELPEWKPWDPAAGAPKYALLDTPAGGGIRMASETYTIERVVADVVADPRLADARERCSVLHALARWDDISPDEYAAAGGGLCKGYALDAYPWTDVAATTE